MEEALVRHIVTPESINCALGTEEGRRMGWHKTG